MPSTLSGRRQRERDRQTERQRDRERERETESERERQRERGGRADKSKLRADAREFDHLITGGGLSPCGKSYVGNKT